MFGLMNIILASPLKTSKRQVNYYLGKILNVIFIIQTSSTWLHENLILHPLHLVMRQLSHMTLSYLPMERKKISIYWMMNILQSLTSLILSQIFQLVINFHHILREKVGLYLSMYKSVSQLKVYLMNSIIIKLRRVNPRSISVYAEGRTTKGHILKKFTLDCIKSDLWFYILNFVSQINITHQRILVKL